MSTILAKLKASVAFDPDREPRTIAEAKRLQRYWKSKRAALERAVAAGKLVSVDDVRQRFAELKTAVLAIPRRAQSQIPSITNDDVAAMEATLRRVLRRGADRLTRLTAKAAQLPSATTPASKAKRSKPGRQRKGHADGR